MILSVRRAAVRCMQAPVEAAVRAARRIASFASAAVVCLGCSGSSAQPPPPDAGASGNFALHFNGTTDYATTGTAGFPSGRLPQTISLWVRYSDATAVQTFVSLRQSFASGIEVGLRDGTIAVWTVYAGKKLVEAPVLPPTGVWHHVAYVFDLIDGGFSNTLYIDGAESAKSDATPDKLTPLSSWLGSVDGTRQLYTGDMDEVRIWHLARSRAEVLQDMQGLVGSQEPGLVAYFDCNAIEGTRVADDSGNGNDATLGGGNPAYMPALVPSVVPPPM